MKQARLSRAYLESRTDGVFTFDDISFTTFERVDNNNQPMVSCIPEGEYLCKKTMMASHGVERYQLQKVKDRSAIFIHVATLVEQLHGCIGSSRKNIELMELWANDEDFTLTITSD